MRQTVRQTWGRHERQAWLGAAFLLLLGAASPPVASAEKSAPASPASVDVSDIRDKLLLLTDGKSHYIAVVPPALGTGMFYSDGKSPPHSDRPTFYALTRATMSRNGDISWDLSFVDPRLSEGGHEEGLGYISFRDGKYKVDCGQRPTPLQVVEKGEAQKLLASASFERTPRQHRPYALARDDRGVYYYVDRGLQPEQAKQFRLFIGPKGNLKKQKMTNIVSDVQGDIFSTKTGSLRLILNKTDFTWIEHNKPSKLTIVNIDFCTQVASIYNDFGVYAGERLGTPCDDL